MMYRQYEDPRQLEKQLAEKKRELEEAKKSGEYDCEELYYIYMDVKELEDRVNFAWQDEEYDMEVNYER